MTYQDDEEVVIAGIGAKFPEAGSVAELAKKLFAGENLMTKDPRILTKGFYEGLPEYHGKTTNNSVMFDNTFFAISALVATAMDPLTCQTLERTFEAVIDAGINPNELRGSNTVVLSGTCHSDSDLEWATDTRSGYGIMGRNRCMNSNRISYWLDLNGPSISTDSGWTNGISNLFHGWTAIKTGKCDTAIVSTASLQSHPLITTHFKDFGLISPDGISRTFDDSANGYGRSSAVVVFVLQRASIAKRCYATIGHIFFTCYGERDEIISKPKQKEWEQLFREFYEQAKIDVNDVQYIEAHGCSTREEDAEELNAINEVFCKDRKTPLLVGCVKSNIGNTEASSSFCGIVKSVISLENELVPRNLHYKNPNILCPALTRGHIKVVDKNTPISPDKWVAVNSHGFGGTYAHIVLKANTRKKVVQDDGIPRLVLLADRMNDYMDDLVEKVENVPYDPEFVGLLHEIHSKRVEKYLGRGYTILPKRENPVHEHQAYGEDKRPLWFIFSGMGSQWPKMGKRLMDLPLFRESIQKSHDLLAEKGLDLIKIITTDDPNIFDNILHSFVGIAAIQVALVDVMRALNITADGYIGHSVGELGCAYADGCFTAEQMVLAAYYRGRASTETELIKGSMAAVGKGYKEIKDQLPDGVEVACHNSADSCTLSGPVDLIHKYVDELKSKGVFARSVNVSNIAYHSRYIRPAAPKLLAYLKQVVKEPKLRSSKWISTSNAESQWDTEVAKYCSAEYHTNNLLSSVLFEEGSKHIPKNAICVEIAPHGLLQAILKRSLGEDVTNIPLTSRSSEDPLIFLLQAIGKMYMVGVDPCVLNLYPKIQYPVSRGTHVLHHLVHWNEQWSATAVTPMEKKVVYSFKKLFVDVADDGTGYITNEENIYPMSMFLKLAWNIFASFQKKSAEECPIVFQNFRLERPLAAHLSEEDNVTITFEIGSGKFEINTDCLLATGTLSLLKDQPNIEELPKSFTPNMTRDDIFNELKRKGFGVGDHFKNLSAVSFGEEVLLGEIPIKSSWVQSIESLIQLYLLKTECPMEFFMFPRGFERLEIACNEHNQYKNAVNDSGSLIVSYDVITNTATCGGIKIRGLNGLPLPRQQSSLKFPSTEFFPLMDPSLESSLKFADVCFSLVLDNIGLGLGASKNLIVVNVMEVMEENQTASIGPYLQQMFRDFKIKLKTVNDLSTTKEDVMDFIITPQKFLEQCKKYVLDGGFVFLKTNSNFAAPSGFSLIGKFQQKPNDTYVLLKKNKPQREELDFITVEGNPNLLSNTLRNLKPSSKTVYIVCYKEAADGLLNYKKRMQAETAVPLRWVFILDPKAPRFSSTSAFYSEQLKKGLTTNVYKDGSWRGYCEYNLSESVLKDDVNLSLESSNEMTPAFVSFDLKEDILKLKYVEYSGKMNGVKVMGLCNLSQYRKIEWEKYLTWEVPDSWTLEEAASAPLAYVMAYYCLVIIGKTKKNENVMITDGLTCIGQASIAVALTVAARVWVTVNNEEEVVLIRKLFPQLKETDVITHSDSRYDLLWKLQAKDSYAHVIVNNLEGERFFSLLNCTGQFGRMFHFGRNEAEKNKQLGLSIFLMSLALYSETPESVLKMTDGEKMTLNKLMADGIKKGVVRPLPRAVVMFDELKKVQSEMAERQNRMKTIVPVNTIQQNPTFVKFDTNSSYLIIGDGTDVWVDVAEWLINRGLQNIVVSAHHFTDRTNLRMPHLQKHNVLVCQHQDIRSLIQEAEKLAPISAVYYINMKSSDVNGALTTLDKSWRNPSRHLLAVTKGRGSTSELCARRNELGFPSTNFIWDAEEMFINEHLEFMGKLCGRTSVIHVTPLTALSKSDHRVIDLVPSTIDGFCDLGSSLEDEVRITPLQTLAGGKEAFTKEAFTKEFVPLFFIPGLHNDPVSILQPVVSDYLYPAFCIQAPNKKLSLPMMASFIVPEMLKMSRGKVFNIVGISWGTHLALELTKKLEEVGATVGLILVEGPFMNAKSLVTKSLESDLLNLIQECSKVTTTVQLSNEVITEKTWQRHLSKTASLLNLPPQKEADFCRGATFVYNSLQALLDQDVCAINIKGPLTLVISEGHSFDDKIIWKLSKSVWIRSLPCSNEELLTSKQTWKIIHGSAISRSMSAGTIHQCSYRALDDYMQQKVNLKLGHDFEVTKIKFTFTC